MKEVRNKRPCSRRFHDSIYMKCPKDKFIETESRLEVVRHRGEVKMGGTADGCGLYSGVMKMFSN